MSVTQRLQVERVLATLGREASRAELKSLLTPILAASKEDQARLYRIFDDVDLPAPPTARWTSNAMRKQPPAAPRTGSRRLWMWVLAPVAAGGVYLAASQYPGPLERWRTGVSAAPGQAAAGAPHSPLSTVLADAADTAEIKPRPRPAEGSGTGRQRAAGGWLLITAAPLVFWLAWELYRAFFLRAAALRGREARSPFSTPAPAANALPFDPEAVRLTAREAARRRRSDTVRLSLPRTVRATVAARGYPAFRYDTVSRPSEYLALLERRGPHDHQARLFDELCGLLVEEGVLLRRYFFDSDPRVCYAETGGRGVGLAELHREYPGHRLLVFSDGRPLTEPATGELLAWTTALTAWRERVLLTPEPVGSWGMPEAMISDELPVFPATLAGMRGAVEHVASETEPDWYAWWERNQESPAPSAPAALGPESLRGYLGEDGYRWLCALAVYPELHWRLTLLITSLPEIGRLDERALLRLVRLRWLRRGSIPDADREWLIAGLRRETEDAVRRAIVGALEAIGEEVPGTARRAGFDHLVQQLFLHRDDPKKLRHILRRLRKEPRDMVLQDAVVVRLLERVSRSRLHVPLPGLERLLYQDGLRALGLRRWARGVLCAGAAVLLWGAMDVFPSAGPLVVPVEEAALVPGARIPLPPVSDTAGARISVPRWTSADPAVVRMEAGSAIALRGGATRLRADALGGWGGFPITVRAGAAARSGPSAAARVADRVMTTRSGMLRPVLVSGAPRRQWVSCSPGLLSVTAAGQARARASGTALVANMGPGYVEYGRVIVSLGRDGASVSTVKLPAGVLTPAARQALDNAAARIPANQMVAVSALAGDPSGALLRAATEHLVSAGVDRRRIAAIPLDPVCGAAPGTFRSFQAELQVGVGAGFTSAQLAPAALAPEDTTPDSRRVPAVVPGAAPSLSTPATGVVVADTIPFSPPSPVASIRTIRFCAMQDGAPREVEYVYDVFTGDTMYNGRPYRESDLRLDSVFAAQLPWFTGSEPVMFGGYRYAKYSVPRILSPTEVQPAGRYQGVPVVVETGTTAPPEIIYMAVRFGCEFQPYQIEREFGTPP